MQRGILKFMFEAIVISTFARYLSLHVWMRGYVSLSHTHTVMGQGKKQEIGGLLELL